MSKGKMSANKEEHHSQEATSFSTGSKKRKLDEITSSPESDAIQDQEARRSFKRLKLSQDDYDG